ncbi:MAG: TrmH family RNA methyltransferase [Actinomycetes bacterium]
MTDAVAAITSVRAAPVVAARRLHRRRDRVEEGRFLAEGPRAVGEALSEHRARGGVVLELFCTEGADVRHPTVVVAAQQLGVPTHVVSEHVAATLSETRTPQGLIAVCALPESSLSGLLATAPRLVVVLVDVADPGNAGTVVRVADAAGADGVVFAGSTVDPYNGKCVRASTGSLFHLPVVTADSADAVVTALRESGLRVLAADVHAPADLNDAGADGLLTGNVAWLFGHEVRGLTGEGGQAPYVANGAHHTIRVPIYGRAESLNLATAAAVCLYATVSARQATVQ